MAMCRNFYLHLIRVFSKKVSFVKTTYRLKKFIFRFVIVPFKWIRQSRQKVLKLYTKKGISITLIDNIKAAILIDNKGVMSSKECDYNKEILFKLYKLANTISKKVFPQILSCPFSDIGCNYF